MNTCQEAPYLRLAHLGVAPTVQSNAVAMSQLPLALFDEIASGLIVCDSQARIRFANDAAQQELATRRVLMRADGKLVRAPGASGDLDTAISRAAQLDRRSLVRFDRDGDRLMASVMKLPLPDVEIPHVLVMLGRRHPCSDLGLEMLAGSYGLTLSERRVLAALMREATPREIAAEHAVAVSTVRSQISSIRAKLGTRRIDGLLLRAAEMPPVAGALRMTSRASVSAMLEAA